MEHFRLRILAQNGPCWPTSGVTYYTFFAHEPHLPLVSAPATISGVDRYTGV
jgi:hypothetical protein